jgi:putative serine/threonine protein kinase
VLVDQLIQEPYASILCFPKPIEPELQSRAEELRGHGVSALEFSGKASVYGVQLPVLGKGFVGVVVIAYLSGQRVAVKIRRTDADRANLLHEARMLSIANSVNVAPKLFGVSKNFLLMQLIDGDLLPDWLEVNKEAMTVKRVLGEVLEQCFRLDEAGLDHGELSKAPKHVIVDRALKPWIVDFETSSDGRKPANVSAVCSYLFCSQGEVARTISETIGARNDQGIIKVLHDYKQKMTRENFKKVLSVCLS